ncbi:hypothetical protein [Sphingopyxis sp. NJF-3]
MTPTDAPAPETMDMLAAVMNARFALEYWMREAWAHVPEAEWAQAGQWRSSHECQTLAWIEQHLRKELDTPS